MSPSLLMTVALLAAEPAAPSATSASAIEHYELGNGLHVVLHDDPRIPLVAVRIVYHVGQRHDPAGKEGVTHLLEHSMFGGSVVTSEGQHAAKLFHAGASLVNAYNDDAVTVYKCNVPTAAVTLALWLEGMRMRHFRAWVHRPNIDRERRTVTDELIQGRAGDDLDVMTAVLHDLVFPEGHPLHRQDAKSVARITVADVRAMADLHYGPGNATLVLSGALPDDVRALIELRFGDAEGGRRPPAPSQAAAVASTRTAQLRSGRAVAPTVLVGWPVAGRLAVGDAETQVLARVLESRGAMLPGTAAIAELDVTHTRMVGTSLLASSHTATRARHRRSCSPSSTSWSRTSPLASSPTSRSPVLRVVLAPTLARRSQRSATVPSSSLPISLLATRPSASHATTSASPGLRGARWSS